MKPTEYPLIYDKKANYTTLNSPLGNQWITYDLRRLWPKFREFENEWFTSEMSIATRICFVLHPGPRLKLVPGVTNGRDAGN